MLNLISFLERLKPGKNAIRSLYVERVNVSHTILFKFCKSISNFAGIIEISLSGNHLPYFCIDALMNAKTLPQGLRLSDTRMDDLSAFGLVSRIIKQGNCNGEGIRQLDLSRNPLLSYPFYTKLAEVIQQNSPCSLEAIDLHFCTISEQCINKIGKLLSQKSNELNN